MGGMTGGNRVDMMGSAIGEEPDRRPPVGRQTGKGNIVGGYVHTTLDTDALELFSDERVRFAAKLHDGTGFVAFDGDDSGFAFFGTIWRPVENILHPWIIVAPKRRVGTGLEHYSLVSVEFETYLATQDTVTGLCRISDALLLVESDGPIVAGQVWNAAVVEFRDKRLEFVPA